MWEGGGAVDLELEATVPGGRQGGSARGRQAGPNAHERQLLDEVEGTLEVSLSPTKIRFNQGNAVLTSKRIDGTFPDDTRVITTGDDKLLKLDTKNYDAGGNGGA